MTAAAIEAQYGRGDLRQRIEDALRGAGKNPSHLTTDDLAPLDEFHLLGRLASIGMADLARITAEDRVLDVGSGIAGPARMLAASRGCQVTAVDLTAEFCEIAEWLSEATGLASLVTVRQANALALPFPDGAFDVVWSQHAQMNIADKAAWYAEARRVLRPGGRLALWEVTAGPSQPIHFPVMWADTADVSFLATPDQLRATVETAGFAVAEWQDLTTMAIDFVQQLLASPPGPLGPQAYVPDLPAKIATFLDNLRHERAGLVQALLVAE